MSKILWMNNISLYIYFAYSFICWQASGLVPSFNYCEWCCEGHGYTDSSLNPTFSLWAYAHVKLLEHIVMFKFLRNNYTVFHSSCTILHPRQQCRRVKISTHFYQLVMVCFCFFAVLCLVLFLSRAILNSTEWHFPLVLI